MTYSYEDFTKQLGAKLRAMRLERGWTLRDMIIQHGYHLVQWQGLEKGKGLSVPSLLRLCKVFDVKLTALIDGLGEEVQLSPRAPEKAVPARAFPAAKKKTGLKPAAKRPVPSRAVS